MPRRRTLSGEVLDRLLALPTDEAELIRHYTLGPEDHALVRRCRRDHNRFGFALQLCALRYPGRTVRPGETVPLTVVRFLCEQLDIDAGAVAGYARRAPTRHEHLDTVRDAFGIRAFSRPHVAEMSAWLLPVALATTDAAAVAAALMAAHVVDGLLQHGGAVAPVVHHVDGGGVSDHVFGLLTLLGFRFAPRIPNLRDRRLYAFGSAASWPTLEPLVAERLNAALILDHWDDLQRLAVSVRTGAVSAAVVLKRLGAYPRQNGLALALRELGRLERTLFTLDWLEDPALRRQATVELNKGEARNALARAVCFHRLGRVRDRSPESLHNRASGLAFVTAAIVLWNTVHLERALAELRAEGEAVPDELLGYLSPLGWQHINLTGDYIWTAEPPVPATTADDRLSA